MTEETQPPTIRRLNRRALIALTAFVLVLGGGTLALQRVGPDRLGRQAARQIEQLVADGRREVALRHLGRYLDRYPDDRAMLFLRAELMGALARDRNTDLDLLQRTASLHDRLLRQYPDDPESDEVRAQLAELYIRISDGYQVGYDRMGIPEQGAFEARYRAAAQIARDLIDRQADDPRAHRLLGQALEGLATPGRREELRVAIASYDRALTLHEQALRRDPDDEEAIEGILVIATRLTRIQRDRNDDPEAAEAVLDRLVSIRPEAVDPLLVRYRYHRETRNERQAAQELRAALRLAPDDPAVRLTASEHALHLGDPAAARAHLEAITEDGASADQGRVSLQVRLMNGLIEYAEQHPAAAVDQWREGLMMVGGGDANLNWWLAYVLIRQGQLTEADLLIEQYRRLSGDEDNPRLQLLHALRDEKLGKPQAAIEALEKLYRDRHVEQRVRDEAHLALARCHESLGNLDQAASTYRSAVQSDPRSITPVVEQALLLRRAGRFDEATRLVERALEERAGEDQRRGGQTVGDLKLLLLLAQIQLAEQASQPASRRSWTTFDRVVSRAEQAIREASHTDGDVVGTEADFPLSVDLTLMLADRSALAGRADEADARLERALERWPNDPRLWAARAELLIQLGRADEAIQGLERGLEAAGESVSLRLMLARALVAVGRGREAQARLVGPMDRLSPDQRAEIWQALGRLRMSQADYEGAREAFTNWGELRSGSPEPVMAQIELDLLVGDPDRAMARLDQIGGGGPGEDDPRSGDLTTRLARASILFRQAELADNANDRRIKLTNAEKELEGALRIARELPEAHRLQGRVLEAQGRLEEAESSYREAWQRGDLEALTRLADLLTRIERFDALERLVSELEQSASSAGVLRGFGQLSAQLLTRAGELDRAGRLLDRAAGSAGASSAWRDRMLVLAGRSDRLENELRGRAEDAAPDDPEPWIALVTTQARNGRERAALEVTIRRALDRAIGVPAGLLEARLRQAIGDLRGADEALEGALGGPSVEPRLLVGAALFYQETGRPDRAEPLLERLGDSEAIGDAATLQLAMLLAERAAGDPETWERALELIGPENDDPSHRIARAVVLARAPDPSRRGEAIPVFEELLADLPVLHPRAIEARDQLARLLIELGQADRAVQVTAISAGRNATSAAAIALHVRALLLNDRLAEAASELDRLERLRPGGPEVAELRAERLLKVGNGNPGPLERAIADRWGLPGAELFARAACLQLCELGTPEAIDAADQIADRLTEASPGRGWVAGLVLAVRGQSAEALRRCASAVEAVDLADPVDRIGLVDAVLMAVRSTPIDERSAAVDQARPMIEVLRQRRPGDPDLLIASAILSHQAGDYQSEADLYQQALERRPGDAMALYNLALVLSEGLGRAEEALRLIDQLAARIGPSPQILGARGVILTRLGRFDDAIRDLGQAIELAPSADRHYYLARAYHKAGQDERFREQLELARRAGLDAAEIDRWQHDELRRLLSL